MAKPQEKLSFADQILLLLEPMGNVRIKQQYDNAFGLYKDGFMFGIVSGNDVYLKTKNSSDQLFSYKGKMMPYAKFPDLTSTISKLYTGDDEAITTTDDLLKQATKSYWLSSTQGNSENNEDTDEAQLSEDFA